MFTLISAAEARDLSNPTEGEAYARYLQDVSVSITEAASSGIKEIILRIPVDLRDRMLKELSEAGYDYSYLEKRDSMEFFKVNWFN